MDLWEANALATTYTPHPCRATRIRTCDSEATCGKSRGYCDKWGCSYNAYSPGTGRNKRVGTNCKITVVTQFVTSSGKSDYRLVDIKRLYIQEKSSRMLSPRLGGLQVDSVTDGY